jgi:hypothetical protein
MSNTALKKIEAEIACKRQRHGALKGELNQLENEIESLDRVANLLRCWDADPAVADLELAVSVLRRVTGESSPPTGRLENVEVGVCTPVSGVGGVSTEILGGSAPDGDKSLAHTTIMQAAVQILGEHPGEPLHYTELARMALNRGYDPGRKDSSVTKVIRSFGQTLQRVAKESGAVARAGDGRFVLRPNKNGDGN